MESQLQRPSHDHHHHEDDPHTVGLHSVVEGEGEHHNHGEKKSVLKKVKDKAKKIKDTITKHGHGHGQDQHLREDNKQQGYDEDSEDDEGEEIDNDPEVHGAPIYESSAVMSATVPGQTHANLEKPADTREDRYEHNVRDQVTIRPLAPGPPMEAHLPEKGPIGRNVPNVFESKTRIGQPGGTEEDPHSPYNSPASNIQSEATDPTGAGLAPIGRNVPNVEEPKTKFGPQVGLEEDPHAPYSSRASNHQSEVTDTTQAGLDPIGRNVQNVEEPKAKIGPPVGLEEDPHAPDKSRASNYQSKVTDPTGAGGKEADVGPLVREFGNLNVNDASMSNPGSEQRTEMETESKLENPEMNQDSAATENKSVGGKISSATYSVANKAASAKDMVASKLGYGGAQQEGEGQDASPTKPISESASEYKHKVAETLAPVYGKVGGAVMSQVRGGVEGGNSSVSMKEYLSEKFRPGDEDKALSEAITNALHKRKGEEKQVGKVTVSEEVAERLGTDRENKREGEDAVAAGRESAGQGVVERLRDAVGSWLGKSTGVETAKESVGKSYVNDAGSGSTGVGPS